ncbi:dismutase [Seminavis robusta]|uniref:Superoxide dismutase [Cu-Zn] n=1 Tax=Seminavis robusta TaxID=568900 RepID=A0A9N8HF32_9STRA|nr:dismutase [Seminavis robusta]|eukprot:Sro505_g156150.1 dismutase (224) ;mRNA; f:31683-32476
MKMTMVSLLQVIVFLLSVSAVESSSLRGLEGIHTGKDEATLEEQEQEQRQLQNGYYRYGCDRVLSAQLFDPSSNRCGQSACGSVTFRCPSEWSGFTEISYSIRGLTPGKHALHVHQFAVGTGGDSSCLSTGGHWNPQHNNHGGNLNAQRHIGDLGNILADDSGLAEGTLLAYVPLRGNLGINGKAVVVHAGTDDLGTGGDDGSRSVGNAGARPGCGTINLRVY